MKRHLGYLLICSLFVSCGTYNTPYFDLKAQAIASCSGTIKRVEIEAPDINITFQGPITDNPIYINKKNPSYRIFIYLDEKPDYILKLKPNTTYEARCDNGMDQASSILSFTTNDKGIVVSASNTKCD